MGFVNHRLVMPRVSRTALADYCEDGTGTHSTSGSSTFCIRNGNHGKERKQETSTAAGGCCESTPTAPRGHTSGRRWTICPPEFALFKVYCLCYPNKRRAQVFLQTKSVLNPARQISSPELWLVITHPRSSFRGRVCRILCHRTAVSYRK